MRKRIKQTASILLVLVLLLAGSYHGTLPVYAADDSVHLYQWHRAESVEDLKKYIDEDRNTTDYTGKWVPIIIVAEYSDGKQFYINRDTRQAIRKGEAELIPVMNEVGSNNTVGAVLGNGIRSGRDFISRGDLGAMHMYYHGEQSKKYVQKVYDENGMLRWIYDTNITSEVWSLTNDNVADYSDAKPNTVYGLQYHTPFFSPDYLALDQNAVKEWKGTGGLPKTQSPRDNRYTFNQGWTFYNDRKDGYFLIANLFGTTNEWISDFEAPTWGCALDGNSRFNSPNVNKRNMIETPSRAAAYMTPGYSDYRRYKRENYISYYEYAVAQQDVKDKILEQYEHKYDKQETRVWFKIYIGEEIKGNINLGNTTISNQTMTLGYGNMIPVNTTVTVEKGATLIIPEDCWLLLEGTIVNRGTIIVNKNAVVSSSMDHHSTEEDYRGTIICEKGGQLLVLGKAHVLLEKGLILRDGGQVINKGLLVVGKIFSMQKSQIQLGDQGRLAIGFQFTRPINLHTQDFFQESDFDKQFQKRSQSYVVCLDYKAVDCTVLSVDGDSRVILEETSAVDLGWYIMVTVGGDIAAGSKRLRESLTRIQNGYTYGYAKPENILTPLGEYEVRSNGGISSSLLPILGYYGEYRCPEK